MILGCSIDAETPFSADYATSRNHFIALAGAAGAAMKTYMNPHKGPNGETLATDTAWFGPESAANVLVMNSATHGVEGFCGAGAQLDWIAAGGSQTLPPDAAVLMVHALNPHGFAWLRRVTEEGIDLNRNGLDFAQGLPANPGYAELADDHVPRDLEAATLAAAESRLAAWREAYGTHAFESSRSCGQYTHPHGIFYGGTGPSWSIRTLAEICADYRLAERRGAAVIDYHTGLGPHGHGEPICGHRPDTSGQARCRAWYGDSLGEPMLGTSASLVIPGLTQYAWARHVGDDRLTFVALEFGTYDRAQSTRVLRDDHVLHQEGAVDWASPRTQAIKGALKKFYFPDLPAWRQMVLFRSRQCIAQALAGLNGHPCA